jgi:hypothetical protein
MSAQMIKAIETRYKGYRFRSRLEARWAVFLDTLGIAWEYEKEGYDLGEAGWYLPDFWLPEMKIWAEVKAEIPVTSKGWNNFQGEAKIIADKCGALAWHTQSNVLLVDNRLMGFLDAMNNYPAQEMYPYLIFYPHPQSEGSGWYADHCQEFCDCLSCAKIGICYEGDRSRINCECVPGPTDEWDLEYENECRRVKGGTGSSRWIDAAYAAARSARFEHGESGVGQ